MLTKSRLLSHNFYVHLYDEEYQEQRVSLEADSHPAIQGIRML
jgi:hypothetical protein